MTTLASPSWVSHLSRRKLQSVADDTGDALPRCVLIHNVMRSTASSSTPAPTQPSPPQPQPTPQPQFVFPSMDYSQEQQWLDSLLDDLESDVQVSVVSVDDRRDASECCPPSSVASPSLSIQQPANPPTFESLDSLFYASPDEDEEPSSPPPLEDHDESDDEDNDDSDSEATTPTSSTELLGAAPPNGVPPDYFFNNLPYNRLRPPHFDLFY